MCVCLVGYTGDPFAQCNPVALIPQEILKPCNPSPCGSNAICREQKGVGACQCLDGYFGNPYEGCRPECVVNSDCPLNKACSRIKCIDPCPGTCGTNAICQVNNHMPNCICQTGYTGNPFSHCSILRERKYRFRMKFKNLNQFYHSNSMKKRRIFVLYNFKNNILCFLMIW